MDCIYWHADPENEKAIKDKLIAIGDTSMKDAATEFERISYDKESNTSLIKCIPKTGRTHQIRVHLASLGFPISNDIVYKKIIAIPDKVSIIGNQILKDINYDEFHTLNLHAFEYNLEGKVYTAPYPDWAKPKEKTPEPKKQDEKKLEETKLDEKAITK